MFCHAKPSSCVLGSSPLPQEYPICLSPHQLLRLLETINSLYAAYTSEQRKYSEPSTMASVRILAYSAEDTGIMVYSSVGRTRMPTLGTSESLPPSR